jgi:tRNA 2-thiouridine synthesizing protein A
MTEHLLDTRGQRCPWPALRLARLMRGAAQGDSVVLLFDDQKARLEIADLCESNGWSLGERQNGDNRAFIILR